MCRPARHFFRGQCRPGPGRPYLDRRNDRLLACYTAGLKKKADLTGALVVSFKIRSIGEVFDAYARVCDAHGHRGNRMNATGYSLGTTFAPNWMDWPMLYHGNAELAAPGMVFFLHMIVFDAERGLAMTLGRTSEVTATGARVLSSASLDFALS